VGKKIACNIPIRKPQRKLRHTWRDIEVDLRKISLHLRFEVFTAVTMKNTVFWDVTPCGSCKN
jgi:hypothetical protein